MRARNMLTLCTSLAIVTAAAAPAPAQLADTTWPMFQFDPPHTGKTTAVGPASSLGVKAKWTYKSVSWIKTQVAIGSDGTVFFGDSKFPICAVAADRAQTDPPLWCADDGGYVNASSPALGNPVNGVQTAYIGDRNNIFWAFDSRTGVDLWHYKIPLDGDVHSSPMIANGKVYMACGCTTKGVVHAFDANPTVRPDGTASPTWKVDLPHVRNSSPAGVYRTFNGQMRFRIYIGTADGQLAAVDDNGTTGTLVWTIDLGSKDYHSSPSIGPDGTIYVGSDKGLYAIEDKGDFAVIKPGWPFTDDNTPGEWDTAPALSNGIVYASRYHVGKRVLYAIDVSAPSTALWKKGPLPGTSSTAYSQTPSTVIDGNGNVYAAFGDTVYALNALTGAEIWAQPFKLGDDAISLALSSGVLYVAARDFKLYALVSK